MNRKAIRSFVHGDNVTTYWNTGEVSVSKTQDYFKSIDLQKQHDHTQPQYEEETGYEGYTE